MTVIDFMDLSDGQSKLYDQIASDIEPVYSKIIESIYKKNYYNRNWYFSSVASRSPHQSPLFERLCKLSLIDSIRNEIGNIGILLKIDDYLLHDIILKNHNYDGIEIHYIGKHKDYLKNFKKIFLDFFKPR